jgi:hypothetical protein
LRHRDEPASLAPPCASLSLSGRGELGRSGWNFWITNNYQMNSENKKYGHFSAVPITIISQFEIRELNFAKATLTLNFKAEIRSGVPIAV